LFNKLFQLGQINLSGIPQNSGIYAEVFVSEEVAKTADLLPRQSVGMFFCKFWAELIAGFANDFELALNRTQGFGVSDKRLIIGTVFQKKLDLADSI
jgi:hypothetical protein